MTAWAGVLLAHRPMRACCCRTHLPPAHRVVEVDGVHPDGLHAAGTIVPDAPEVTWWRWRVLPGLDPSSHHVFSTRSSRVHDWASQRVHGQARSAFARWHVVSTRTRTPEGGVAEDVARVDPGGGLLAAPAQRRPRPRGGAAPAAPQQSCQPAAKLSTHHPGRHVASLVG